MMFGVPSTSWSFSFCTFLHSPATSSPLGTLLSKHPRPEDFLYSQTPSYTPIQVNRQYYISLYLNVYIFVSKGKEIRKILHQIVGKIFSLIWFWFLQNKIQFNSAAPKVPTSPHFQTICTVTVPHFSHVTVPTITQSFPASTARPICWAAINPLNAELNPICYLLPLLGAHHFLPVSRIRVKSLILRLLMLYIYIYIYIWSTYSWCF